MTKLHILFMNGLKIMLEICQVRIKICQNEKNSLYLRKLRVNLYLVRVCTWQIFIVHY